MSTLVLSYNHDVLDDILSTVLYIPWDKFNHNGDDSYAIVKKLASNEDGIIIDVIGDAMGNNDLSWYNDPLSDTRLIRKYIQNLGNNSKNLGNSKSRQFKI